MESYLPNLQKGDLFGTKMFHIVTTEQIHYYLPTVD